MKLGGGGIETAGGCSKTGFAFAGAVSNPGCEIAAAQWKDE